MQKQDAVREGGLDIGGEEALEAVAETGLGVVEGVHEAAS